MFSRFILRRLSCFKCNTTVPETFPPKCPSCSSLQPVKDPPNYFNLLTSKQQFSVDINSLTKAHKSLQKVLHPDLYTNKDEVEKEASQILSGLINKALVTLLDPLKRGSYLLELKGRPPKEVTLDGPFLMLAFEFNETVEEIKSKSEWEQMRATVAEHYDKLLGELEINFSNGDDDGAEITIAKLRYFRNLNSQLKEVQSRLGIVL